MPFQLVYFSSVLLIAGACTLLQPFSPSLLTLTGLRFAAYFSAGFFGAVNIALFVYTMGPVRSRPYTMAIHLLVGVGFLVGSFVVRPFLPGEEEGESGKERDFQAVCVLKGEEGGEGILFHLAYVLYVH